MRASYPTYKSTLIPWPESIPESWELVKISSVFRERRETVSDKDFAPLSVTMQGIVPQLETAAKTDNGDNRKKVCAGDFVINSRSDRKGSAGISPLDGSVSVISIVLKPLKRLNERYVNYLLTNYYFQEEFYRYGKGIVADLWSTKYSSMKGMFIPLPSLEEQTAIANYLDAKTEQINRFIAKKERLIALLKEQKQAVINELLEDKEGKWERRKLRHAIKGKLKYGANESGIPYNPEYPRYIRITDFGSDGKLRNDDMLSLLPSVAKDYILKNGDILFARSGGTVGKTFQYKRSDADANFSCYAGYLIKAEPNEKIILSDFLYIYTLSGYYEQWKQGIFNKATIENIGADKYSQLLIPVPPIETQKAILSNINSETAKIDEAISRIEKEIEKVKELKQSLIAEVVTGSIKVA